MKLNSNIPLRGVRSGFRVVSHGVMAWMMIALIVPPVAWANPEGGEVVAGSASFSGGAGTLTITTSDRVIINWQDFSIGSGELTRFVQPSSGSAALNRVVSGNPSSILGTLEANGQIYLINPNGILVGAGAQINTASFIASTLDVNNADFMAGVDLKMSGASMASVVNQGSIHALGGDVFLVGRQVENQGTILAPNGTVGLAAGNEVLLRQSGEDRLMVKLGVEGGERGTGVSNKGMIQAAQAELKAAGGNVYALAINNEGAVRATGFENRNGRVILTAGGGNIHTSGSIKAGNPNGSGGNIIVDAGQSADRSAPATAIVSGTLDASSVPGAGRAGGSVDVFGENVGLFDQARVDVSGDTGGGSVRVGGDFHGANPGVQNSQRVFLGGGTTISANTRERGDGGTVAVWADDWTKYFGAISATGGGLGGNGGFVEVSGRASLEYNGLADLSATAGEFGTLLLDPTNITISNADANNTSTGGNPNTFTGTAAAATINAATLVGALGSANVIVSTASAFASAGTITVNNPIVWATGNDLTLTSNSGTTINAAITGTGGGSVIFNAGTTLAIGGAITLSGGTSNLSITSNGAVTQTQPVSIAGTTTINSGAAGSAVTLSNAANDFGGAVSVTTVGAGGNINVRDANALVLGSISMANVASTLTLTSNGAITQSGVTTITSGTGLVTINSGATGSPVTLSNANNFRGAVGVTTATAAGNVAITDANTLVLGTIAMANAASTLTVNSTGAITQSGVLTITSGTGAVSFNSGAAGAAITLSNANDFRGDVSLTNVGAFNVNVRDANALSLGGVSMANAAGTLTITSNGAITETGTITSGTGLVTINSGAGGTAITLAGANDFRGAVRLTTVGAGGNINVNDANALVLDTLSMANAASSLTVTSDGAITQNGATTITTGTGAVSFNSGATGAAITLSNNNDFRGAVSLTNLGANNVAITDANALSLGTVSMANAAGTLTITSNGAITETGTITSGTGLVTINSGAGGTAITLAGANDFRGAVRLTTVGAGGNINLRDANALVLDTVSMANAASTLTLNSDGSITQNGATTITSGTGLVTINSGATGAPVTLTNANDFRGAVGVTTATAAGNVAITDANTLVLGTIAMANAASTLTVNSTGAITQSGVLTITSGTGAVSFNSGAAGAAITLSNANDFRGDVSLTNVGAFNVNVRDANALSLGGVSMANAAGTLTITSNGAITETGTITSGTGLVTINSGAAGSAVTLNNGGNDFRGAVGVTTATAAGNVAVTDANTLVLGTIAMANAASTLTVNSTGAITQSGALIITSGTGAVSFNSGATGAAITLSNANDFRGAVSLTNVGANNIAITDANALSFGTVSMANAAGALTINSNGAITETGTITSGTGLVIINSGAAGSAITLAGANDFRGAVRLTTVGAGGNINVNDANALLLDTVSMANVASTLTVGSDGAITQNGATTITSGTGVVSFNSGATGAAITLSNANDFRGGVGLNNTGANNVAIRDANTLALRTSTVGQNLAVTTGGALTETGVLTVPGTLTLAATAANSDMLLATQLNDFGGAVSFGGVLTNIRDVGLRNVNAGAAVPSFAGLTNLRNVTLTYNNAAVALAATTVTGTMTVTAGGAISQSGALVVPGVSSFIAGANAIMLNNAGNNFTGAVTLSNSGANDVSIRDSNALSLAASGVGSGTLTIQTGGAITQTGAITQAVGGGAVSVTTGAAAITLNNAGNDFTGAVSLSNSGANNVSLRDANALALGTVGVGTGTLTVRSVGALTQGGAITQTAGAGAASFTAGAGAITLDNAGNNFIGAVTLSNSGANNVSIRDANALSLAASGVGSGTLTIQTGGAITQTGAITQAAGAGAVTVNAGANAITLSNAGNNFTGAVSVNNSGANNVSVRDANALDLGASSVAGGTLTLRTGAAALTQSGALTVNQLVITAGGSVTLTDTANLITSLGVISRGGSLDIRDSAGGLTIGGAITAGTINNDVTIATLGGNLTLSANISNTGAGNEIILATDRNFINTAGAAALSAAGGARYLTYSTAPGLDTTGGLTSSFVQYSTIFPTAPSAGNTGSGFLYSSAAPVPPSDGGLQALISSLLSEFADSQDRFERFKLLYDRRELDDSGYVVAYAGSGAEFLPAFDEVGDGDPEGFRTVSASSYSVFGSEDELARKGKGLRR